MRPVLFDEAMSIDIENCIGNQWSLYYLIRFTYKLAQNIDNKDIKDDILLRLREAAVFESRITKKRKQYNEKDEIDYSEITTETAMKEDMYYNSPDKWTVCEVMRKAYSTADSILDIKLKKELQLKFRQIIIATIRLVTKIKEYKNSMNIDACADEDFRDVSWKLK